MSTWFTSAIAFVLNPQPTMSRGINNQNVVYPEESTTTRTYTISTQQGEGTVYDFGASDIELQVY